MHDCFSSLNSQDISQGVLCFIQYMLNYLKSNIKFEFYLCCKKSIRDDKGIQNSADKTHCYRYFMI